MTRTEILNSNRTKTWKIQELLKLGLTRDEVAGLVGANYGFVHNVFAKLYPERIRRNRSFSTVIEEAEWTLSNFNFNHTFGVEIEAHGIDRSELAAELNEVGIQVNVEGYNHNTRNHWKVVTDGSLVGDKTFELVSPKLSGAEGLRQLKTVLIVLKGLEAKVNKTCGLHIHFDASSFNLTTWKNLYKNYAKIEKLIDGFMPTSRRSNNNYYCKSMRVQNYEAKINGSNSLEEIERQVTQRNRYYKLNTQSFWRHGSVEFRQHSGSVDYKKVSNWILFLARLVEYSKQAELKNETWATLNRFLPEELISYYRQRTETLAS